ncbi:THUMP-like domain-containing protein [Galbibacter mesophilus]|uniref:THUMP-like domain-containing protein n=1 Tax=Galbibacter mesophilus TaxID=379069 RepID=UPI00191D1B8E|nr:RsmD family RNA methyltransferase [Galbibacter mesophilus]MCM5663101.1 class I SAM-dependent methyltransferase [Galbibacter mesophilus]
MNKYILNTGVQDFINKNLSADISSLLLKGAHFKDVSTPELAEQIESKKRSQKKLPTWFNTEDIYYPNKLNIEQTSSESTAQYKASLVDGKKLLDLTGGFGVDSFYFSKKVDEVYHCEIDENLSQIASHNFEKLGIKNIQSIAKNGIEFLKESNFHFDYIYIDPARRDNSKSRVFLLQDCTPDILNILPTLLQRTLYLLVKTSPLLDIKKGIEDLKYVQEIHVVSVNNEVKELLWKLTSEENQNPVIKTINLKKENDVIFNFNFDDEQHNSPKLGLPEKYLYEPNASILKSGAFTTIGKKLDLLKLHPHTHLYTSNMLIDFPGRRFEVLKTVAFNKKTIKKELSNKKANITTRNFPDSANKIRERFKVKDGGDLYVFFCTNLNNEKLVVFCKKA